MHDAAYYIQLLLSGVTVGSLYALIAIGYTMCMAYCVLSTSHTATSS